MRRSRRLQRFASVALVGALVAGSVGCSGDDDEPSAGTIPAPVEGGGAGEHRASVHRSANGVAHVEAADLGGLGFGTGWAAGEDHGCTLAEVVVSARGQRARWFGAGEGDENVDSDVTMAAFGVPARADAAVAELTPDAAELLEGYAAGVRSWYAEMATGEADGPGASDAAACPTMEVLADLDLAALLAVQYRLALADDLALIGSTATAAPPTADAGAAEGPGDVDPTDDADHGDEDEGDHGDEGGDEAGGLPLGPAVPGSPGGTVWGIGSEMTETGRGALAALPLLDWDGTMRLWEHQLRVPGSIEVYGASFVGVPVPVAGFSADLAFSPTPSPSPQGSAYRLALTEGDATVHLVDGAPEALDAEERSVDVLVDGELETVVRTTWHSRFGPVVEAPGFEWTPTSAIAWHDVALTAPPMVNALLELARSTDVGDVAEALGGGGAPPWAATVVATAEGVTWYGDTAATPRLSDGTRAAFEASLADPVIAAAAEDGLVVLDGTHPIPPGDDELAPVEEAPSMERRDFVVGTETGSWLANPEEPVLGGHASRRAEPRALALSDRQSLLVLRSMLHDAQQTGGRLGLVNLQEALLGEADLTADLLLDEVVDRCRLYRRVQVPEVRLPSGEVRPAQEVEVQAACSALAGWDRTFTLESRGALLWRGFLEQFDAPAFTVAGTLFEVAFRHADPLGTPRLLVAAPDTGPDPVVVALAEASLELTGSDVALDAVLREVQWAQRGEERIPMHGGPPGLGSLSGVELEAGEGGFEVVGGPGFLLAVAFTDQGPVAESLLAYGQSDSEDALTHADQTYRYSDRAWRPVRFTSADLQADPALETRQVVGTASTG